VPLVRAPTSVLPLVFKTPQFGVLDVLFYSVLPFRHILHPLSHYDSWVPHVRVGPTLIPSWSRVEILCSWLPPPPPRGPSPCGPAHSDDCRGQIRLWGQENPLKVVRRPLSVSGPSPTNNAYLCVNLSRIYVLHARSSIHGNIQQNWCRSHKCRN
jgi:hypothetical protein